MQILIDCDSQVLIDCLLGDASTDMPDLKRPVKLAHVGLQTLIESFRVKPPRGQQMARQVPRSDNSAADAAANAALDQGPFMEVMLNETATFITELSRPGTDNIGLLFSFDGAARGNPGKSSYGVCAWWGHFNHDGFDPKGLLLWKGARLGTSTNNIAEAHGMASSLKICVRFYCKESQRRRTIQGPAPRPVVWNASAKSKYSWRTKRSYEAGKQNSKR